jgi:hypothetical protein
MSFGTAGFSHNKNQNQSPYDGAANAVGRIGIKRGFHFLLLAHVAHASERCFLCFLFLVRTGKLSLGRSLLRLLQEQTLQIATQVAAVVHQLETVTDAAQSARTVDNTQHISDSVDGHLPGKFQ